MNDDEKFDRWVADVARDYNAPPAAVPRDEMWQAIRRGRTGVAPGEVTVTPVGVARSRTNRWWQFAAAAVLLVGFGIGIGRLMPPAVREAGAPGAALATRDGGSPGAPTSRSQSYDAVAVQHLSNAEALLTSFRREVGGTEDETLERWARDLLVDTRLLLDSPAASELGRRHLLEDLELVLAQIVQLPAESSADRSLVHRSIDRGEVLSRIRSSIPAGSARGT